jgi:putative transposase
MPRAHRHFIPGHIWHITERCHARDFLLKVRHDRRRWLWWLFESRRRHGLCVLNYIVTRNHVHLLVRDRGEGEISASMHLVAGRTAQEYNERKGRLGAFWQDRYHATAVESDATSAPLHGLHRSEHGARRRSRAPVRVAGERLSRDPATAESLPDH